MKLRPGRPVLAGRALQTVATRRRLGSLFAGKAPRSGQAQDPNHKHRRHRRRVGQTQLQAEARKDRLQRAANIRRLRGAHIVAAARAEWGPGVQSMQSGDAGD